MKLCFVFGVVIIGLTAIGFGDSNENTDICSLDRPEDVCSFGESNLVRRWYYDQRENRCIKFLFDNECSSYGNVFKTKQQCEQACHQEYDD